MHDSKITIYDSQGEMYNSPIHRSQRLARGIRCPNVHEDESMITLPIIASLITPVGNCNELSCDNCSIMYDTIFGEKMPPCLRLSKSEAYLGMVILA